MNEPTEEERRQYAGILRRAVWTAKKNGHRDKV